MYSQYTTWQQVSSSIFGRQALSASQARLNAYWAGRSLRGSLRGYCSFFVQRAVWQPSGQAFFRAGREQQAVGSVETYIPLSYILLSIYCLWFIVGYCGTWWETLREKTMT